MSRPGIRGESPELRMTLRMTEDEEAKNQQAEIIEQLVRVEEKYINKINHERLTL